MRVRQKRAPTFVVAAALALAAVGLLFFTRGTDRPSGSSTGTDATSRSRLDAVRIRETDLPSGFRRCSFAGDVGAHLDRVKKANEDTYQFNLGVWNRFQEQGATGAYFDYWASSPEACAGVLDRDEMAPHVPGKPHPSVVFTVIIAFATPADAAKAYDADVFGQSALRSARGYEVREGEATGLAPKAIVALRRTDDLVHQAVWQQGDFHVLYGSENLDVSKSEEVTAAVNRRMG